MPRRFLGRWLACFAAVIAFGCAAPTDDTVPGPDVEDTASSDDTSASNDDVGGVKG